MKYVTFLLAIGLLLLAGLGMAAPALADPGGEPTPTVYWQGRLLEQRDGGEGIIVVRVVGRYNLPVDIWGNGWGTTALTGSKPEYGDACEFAGLRPGVYTVTPRGLGAHLDVNLEFGGFALVEFRAYATPPPPPPPIRCRLRVVNQAAVDVRLTLDGREYVFGPGGVRFIEVGPGAHSYSIAAAGYDTINRTDDFPAGYWTWNIDASDRYQPPWFGGGPTPGAEAPRPVYPTATPIATPGVLPVTGEPDVPGWAYPAGLALVLAIVLGVPGIALVWPLAHDHQPDGGEFRDG